MAKKAHRDWLLFLALALLIAGVSPGYRLLAGHWILLVGYAAPPFAVKSFIVLFGAPERKNAFKTAVLLTGFAAHYSRLGVSALFLPGKPPLNLNAL